MTGYEGGRVPLAQAYFHERSREATPNEFQSIFELVREAAVSEVRDVYGTGYAVDIRVEEGSLKVIVTVLGITIGVIDAAWSVYDGITRWPEFKGRVIELCEEAKRFDVLICDKLRKMVKSDKSDVVAQKRLMLPGSLLRLIKKVEALEKDVPRLQREELVQRIGEIKRDLRRISKQLSPQDVEPLYQMVATKLSSELPLDQLRLELPRVALRPESPGRLVSALLPLPYRVADESIPKRGKRQKFRKHETVVVTPPYEPPPQQTTGVSVVRLRRGYQ